jgi:hypothetical protein
MLSKRCKPSLWDVVMCISICFYGPMPDVIAFLCPGFCNLSIEEYLHYRTISLLAVNVPTYKYAPPSDL